MSSSSTVLVDPTGHCVIISAILLSGQTGGVYQDMHMALTN